MKNKATIGLMALFTILIFGLSIYILTHKEESTMQSPLPQSSNVQYKYENKSYGFTLTFPYSWKDYRVKEVVNKNSGNVSNIDFGILDQDDVFIIRVYTKSDWARVNVIPLGNLPSPGIFQAENSEYVFAWDTPVQWTPAVRAFINQPSPTGESVIYKITQTFNLIK